MTAIPKTIISAAALALAIVALLATGRSSASDSPGPQELTRGWQYRWGDSPLDSQGTPTWLVDGADDEWQDLPTLDWLDEREGEWVWYRIQLPASTWSQPALYLPNVAVSIEVYVGVDRVYEFGTMGPDRRNKYTVSEVHVADLPPTYAGQTLAIRVYSNVFAIGIEGVSEPPMIGSQNDIVRRILLNGVDTTAIGFLFVFAGLFSLLLFVIRLREHVATLLSFAAFALLLGVFYIMQQSSVQFLIKSPMLKMYAMAGSFLLFPVGMFAYLRYAIFETSSNRARGIIWGVVLLHLVSAIVIIALDLFGLVMLPVSMRTFSVLFAITIPVVLVITFVHAWHGSTDARIAIVGFAVFGTTGLLDVLQGLRAIPAFYWVSQYGAVIFVGCLAYILERQFAESHRKLRDYSVQLEDKSEQLEEYSRTLEDKVTERTRDLDDKNQQLEGTLQELQDTQQQLIMQEKMASLGGLVAGVAHEVNNPVGAILSASDVSSRCTDVVREYVHTRVEDERSKVWRAADILADNNTVVSEAARRVSEIVKSLKNFARLDEAEFQKVDIHDGIDSTLTLVKHLLKDGIGVDKRYGNLPLLSVYPNQLNQVFMNLIVNAIDAIDGAGLITITTRTDDANAYVMVKDTGKGIASKDIAHVFDPGFTTKGVGVGTGLGLSISYNIVRKHGGDLKVESEPGEGATFTIVLPVGQDGG